MIYQNNCMIEVFAARDGAKSSIGDVSEITDLCNDNRTYLGIDITVDELADADSGYTFYDLWLDRDPTSNIENLYEAADYQSCIYIYKVDSATGLASHAEGYQTVSTGQGSHAEGVYTAALQYGAHAEGQSTALKEYTSYSAWQTAGYNATISRGWGSHAEGKNTFSSGDGSHAEGHKCAATSTGAHAEGDTTYASGSYSHAEGYLTKASHTASHAGGIGTQTSTNYQTAIGKYNTASSALFVVGNGTSDTARSNAFTVASTGNIIAAGTITDGLGNVLSKKANLASPTFTGTPKAPTATVGTNTTQIATTAFVKNAIDNIDISATHTHTELGTTVEAKSDGLYVTGDIFAGTSASSKMASQTWVEAYVDSQDYAESSHTHSDYITNVAKKSNSFQVTGAAGNLESTDYQYATAFGWNNDHRGNYSGTIGRDLIVGANQYAVGHYNNYDTGSNGYVFCVGNGTSSTRANALTVTSNGQGIYIDGTVSTNNTGDYAEYFEWEDGNVEQHDRRGLFVTLCEGNKIKLTDDNSYILGVVAATPTISSGAEDGLWKDTYMKDIFGCYLLDDDGNRIVNPDYDSTQAYTPRRERSEWAPIGLLGQLVVIDDGTCVVGSYCKPTTGGIATAAETGYRVIERLDDTHIKVIIK